MKRSRNLFRSSWLALGIAALAVAPSRTDACGPWFPDSLFQAAYTLLRTPTSSLENELLSIELDIELPGRLVVPSALADSSDSRPDDRSSSVTDRNYLSSLSGEDLLANTKDCRETLLFSSSELARDVAELAGILANRPAPGNAFEALADRTLVKDYEKLRRVMFGLEKSPSVEERIAARQWPLGLPEEFVDYLNGAACFREKKYEEAVRHFERLLARPFEERKHRSTLAAYMIGRCRLAEGDPDFSRSIPHFRRVLALREEGCEDVFRVGWDALKCVADYALKFEKKPELAIRYYFANARIGDRLSQSEMCTEIEKMPIGQVVSDPFLRRLRTAALLSTKVSTSYWSPEALHAGEKQKAWLEAMEKAEVHDVDASRLAWLAYQGGEFDLAGRWLGRARQLDPIGHWVQAKLHLQRGGVAQASRALDRAEPGFLVALDSPLEHPQTETGLSSLGPEKVRSYQSSQYWGDLGMVRLAQDDVIGALEAFVRSGYWFETAYVAEQLLSRDELLRWVLDHCPEDPYYVGREKRTVHAKLRYLTARRLARDHYFKNARTLLPGELLPIFDRYVEGYRALQDESEDEATRIEKGWEAAQIHRKLGMELFGTELGPDWFTLGRGSFSWRSFTAVRTKENPSLRFDEDFADHFRNPLAAANRAECRDLAWWDENPVEGNLPPSRGERWRLEHYAKLPYASRFHYRSVAADLAWEVVRLMPQDDDEAARILAISGSWIADRTPKTADFFYKQLVIRNRQTALGHEADLRRWFPEVDWAFDPWALTGTEKPGAWDWWD